jgi:hypothetical protein
LALVDKEGVDMPKLLKDVLPREFFQTFLTFWSEAQHKDLPTPAARLLDVPVVAEYDGREKPWPGPHKNVMNWWELENGKAVGWNENPAVGWSFPVVKLRK